MGDISAENNESQPTKMITSMKKLPRDSESIAKESRTSLSQSNVFLWLTAFVYDYRQIRLIFTLNFT